MNDLQLTPAGLSLLSAFVGATAAILGHITAGLMNLLREYYMEQRKIRRAEAAAAIEVAVALENVMAICHNILKFERLNVAPDDSLDFHFECELPSVEAINSITYRDLNPDYALEVAKIKSELHAAVDYFSSLDIGPPHYGHAVDQRKRTFATIGARISIIVEKILAQNNLAAPLRSEQYNPKRDFKEYLETTLPDEALSDQ